ncbi:MAG: hypothetical protein ACREQY_11130 [Candidatus Binatia bacterium]
MKDGIATITFDRPEVLNALTFGISSVSDLDKRFHIVVCHEQRFLTDRLFIRARGRGEHSRRGCHDDRPNLSRANRRRQGRGVHPRRDLRAVSARAGALA